MSPVYGTINKQTNSLCCGGVQKALSNYGFFGDVCSACKISEGACTDGDSNDGRSREVRPGWIVSARADFLWFTVGGAASAYIFWALWRFTHVPLILLVAIWAVVFDETHGFATISRTYLDAEERQRRGRWLWGSLAFFLALGPVLILLHLGDWLELATVLWGYYHVFKQHYGFMMMYKKKNRDFQPEDMKLDKVFFAVAFYYPFLTYPLHDKEAAAMLPFPIPPRLASVYENVLLFAADPGDSCLSGSAGAEMAAGLVAQLAEATSFRFGHPRQLPALSEWDAAARGLRRGDDLSQRAVSPPGLVL